MALVVGCVLMEKGGGKGQGDFDSKKADPLPPHINHKEINTKIARDQLGVIW